MSIKSMFLQPVDINKAKKYVIILKDCFNQNQIFNTESYQSMCVLDMIHILYEAFENIEFTSQM